MQHGNAPLTPNGRRRMVALVEDDGLTFEAVAAPSNVSRSTVHTWSGDGGTRVTMSGVASAACTIAPRARTRAPARSPTRRRG
jgi:hypothetical protein